MKVDLLPYLKEGLPGPVTVNWGLGHAGEVVWDGGCFDLPVGIHLPRRGGTRSWCFLPVRGVVR